jgi:16S rRNA (cytosine1402-N4)-methyltransferase
MTYHVPVMLKEVMNYLLTNPDGKYIDCTLGGGGHSEAILKEMSEKGVLIGIDQDEDAIAFAKERLNKYDNFEIAYGNFSEMKTITSFNEGTVTGVLMDLGISSYQIDEASRGFSFQQNGPLDMRMDRDQYFTAQDLVNTYTENELKRIFWQYGEEKLSGKIAKKIVSERKDGEIATTEELKNIINSVVFGKAQIKSQARIFQAIRIEVNRELDSLKKALDAAFEMLELGGRLVIMSYHSLEDRIVKQFIMSKEKKINPELPFDLLDDKSYLKRIFKKAMMASDQELEMNNRSRSARLRVAEKYKES